MNASDFLGRLAEDKITNFNGVIIAVRENLHGCDQIKIQPRNLKTEDGSTKKPETFDLPQVNIDVDTPKVLQVIPNKQVIQLGDKVRDPITGLEGIAIIREVYLNGCSGIGLVPPKNKDGEVHSRMFPEGQLEIVQSEKITPGTKRTGGPEIEMNYLQFK